MAAVMTSRAALPPYQKARFTLVTEASLLAYLTR